MMNAIVLSTLTGAVTEFSNYDFQSLTATHAGAATGLFLLGGNRDLALPIIGEVRTPKRLLSTTLKKLMDYVYLAMEGTGDGEVTVFGRTEEWPYSFPVRVEGESRCQVGRGIRENYLGFGFRNPGGEYFSIDCIEILMRESNSRRV